MSINKRYFIAFLILFVGLAFAGPCDAVCTPPSGSPSSSACQQCNANNGGGGPFGGNSGGPFTGDEITTALQSLCSVIKNALAVGMMLMVVAAALVYAVGQVMGAETRARASVWATSMFNGAIIASLIYLLVPFVLSTLLSGTNVVPTGQTFYNLC